jgi:hypothetical protein
LDPQVRLLTNFGVNTCPFNYGIKVILFRNWLQPPTSSNRICSTPVLSLRNPPESSSRSKPLIPFFWAQIPNGGSKSNCSGKFLHHKLHSAFRFSIFTWNFFSAFPQELSTELLIRTEDNSRSYFLGPVGASDPREFIAAESQRIPFKAALTKPPQCEEPSWEVPWFVCDEWLTGWFEALCV